MKAFFLAFIFFVFALSVFPQPGNQQSGARSLGMAHCDLTVADAWSSFNNIGGISGVKNATAFFSYLNRYGLEGLNTMSAGVVTPAGNIGNFTLNILRYGGRIYNEQKVGFGYGNKVGFVRLGFQIHYLQINVEGLGRSGIWTAEFGGIVELMKKFVFAAGIYNLNVARPGTGLSLPPVMRAGLSFRPVDRLMINGEMIFYTGGQPSWGGGVEYGIYEKLFVRAGVRIPPAVQYFGLGFRPGRFSFDYAFSRHFELGFVHEASVQVRFGTTK